MCPTVTTAIWFKTPISNIILAITARRHHLINTAVRCLSERYNPMYKTMWIKPHFINLYIVSDLPLFFFIVSHFHFSFLFRFSPFLCLFSISHFLLLALLHSHQSVPLLLFLSPFLWLHSVVSLFLPRFLQFIQHLSKQSYIKHKNRAPHKK